MAEMLIVVAILIVLLAVAFIAVPRYQRSMTRLEFDTIAKEIFIAAQNHLTTAESQGYLQRDDSKLGTKGEISEDKLGERYFVYPEPDKYHSAAVDQTALDLMLPFGSIDETIRTGGSYIIRYQPSSGRVLDVFYSRDTNSTYLTKSGTNLGSGDYSYSGLMANCRGDDKRTTRQSYGSKNAVVGWYGDGDSLPTGTRLKDPKVIVHNEEKLWVEVTDTNSDVTDSTLTLKLIVTGEVSGAQKSFTLRPSIPDTDWVKQDGTTYKVTLDDITSGTLHFDNLPHDSTEDFIPGENLTIEAVAFNNAALSNVAYSGKKITNSLFAELTEKSSVTSGGTTTTDYIAGIANFRHFENLDKTISNFAPASCYKNDEGDAKTVNKAEQLKDLRWKWSESGETYYWIGGPSGTVKSVQIYKAATTATTATTEKCLYPVNLDYSLDYDGTNHKIYNVDVSHTVDAGLFGMIGNVTSSTITNEVKNLELIDFNVIISTDSGNAGALAGTAYKATVTNVVAYNTAATGTPDVTASASAGGLIGSVDNCTVSKCAAALTVNGGTYAGGLVGESNAGTVTASYSGGHTNQAKYYTTTTSGGTTTKTPVYNVTATGTAGGLIGAAGTTSIYYSYSTCSVKGATAGGFVGTSSGNIEDCYCTGLVLGTDKETVSEVEYPKNGAFAYSVSSEDNDVKDCKYFEIINELKDSTKGTISYMTALGGNKTDGNVKALDETAATYQTFSGIPNSDWKTARPYDSTLTTYYGGKYNLRTVQQLGATIVTDDDFVTVHHGDWPAPETFVYNQPNT